MAKLASFNKLKGHRILVFSLAILIISLVIGSYLRLYPVFNASRMGYGPILFEMDPYSEYWIASKLYSNGLSYFNYLRPFNWETRIFWYPWGRDFVKTELPMLTFFSVLTYDVAKIFNPELSLYDWMVYLPIIFFIMAAIGIYLTCRELWGDIPAAVAVLTASLMFTDRHVAGFTVKYSVGIAFLFLAVYFHVAAWKRKSLIYAVLAGTFLGGAAFGWAGFNLAIAAIFIQLIALPILKRVESEDILLWLFEALPLVAIITSIPTYHSYMYFIKSAGIIIPAATILLFIGYLLSRLSKMRNITLSFPLFKKPKMLYSLVLILTALGGVYGLISGIIVIRGKGLAAMGLGGLTHVLVGTVQEYRSALPQDFITWGGAAVIVAVVGLIYYLYKGLMKKEHLYVFMGALLLIALYATSNIAYFMTYSNYVVALTASGIIYLLVREIFPKTKGTGWFLRVIAAVILVIYLSAIIGQGVTIWTRTYRSITPTILDSGTGLGADAPAWLDALNWLKNNTPENAVAVSWWDYGYWISVVGERASVADGATINVTQIELLAKALTSDEESAMKILTEKLKINPENLYVIAYELYYIDDYNKRVFIGPLIFGTNFLGADAAKGISAIYRIAGVDIDSEIASGGGPHVMVYSPGTYSQQAPTYSFVLPNWTSSELQNALLYKILLDAAYQVWGLGGYTVHHLYANVYSPPQLPPPEMKLFKPAYIAVSRALSYPDVYVVVAVYKLQVDP